MCIVAADCGRHAGKSLGEIKSIIPSVVGEWRVRTITEGGDYEVIINGHKYFVGELAQKESRFARDMTTKSKIHEETKILTLTAIGLVASDEKVKLVTGLPVDQHTPSEKERLKNLLVGDYDIKINGNHKKIKLTPENIIVTIEGAGAYISSGQKGKCRVIDAGSRTINTITIDENGKYIDLQSGTFDYGCMNLNDDENAKEFTRQIITDLSKKWKNYNKEPVLLAGGGADIIEKYLKEHFSVKKLSNPIFANVYGYQALGVSLWR